MTFHRTCGTNGTRNSKRERHADEYLPNFNKSTSDGYSAAPKRGRKMNNPGPGKNAKDTPRQRRAKTKSRYDRMMAGIEPRRTLAERIASQFIGRSKVTGRR